MRRIVKSREEDGSRLGDWIALSKPDFDRILQNAMERVFKALDLPRRSDIETLNENLLRVADAVEALDRPSDAAAIPVETGARRLGGDG